MEYAPPPRDSIFPGFRPVMFERVWQGLSYRAALVVWARGIATVPEKQPLLLTLPCVLCFRLVSVGGGRGPLAGDLASLRDLQVLVHLLERPFATRLVELGLFVARAADGMEMCQGVAAERITVVLAVMNLGGDLPAQDAGWRLGENPQPEFTPEASLEILGVRREAQDAEGLVAFGVGGGLFWGGRGELATLSVPPFILEEADFEAALLLGLLWAFPTLFGE